MQKQDKKLLGPALYLAIIPSINESWFSTVSGCIFFPVYLSHCYANLIVLICTKVLGKSLAGLCLGLESYSFLSRRPQSDRLMGTTLLCPGNVFIGSFFRTGLMEKTQDQELGSRCASHRLYPSVLSCSQGGSLESNRH